MPNPPLPIPATTIQAAWGQDVTTRVVNVYQNAAARNAALTTPEDGQLAYLIDEDLLTVRVAGVLWITLGVGTFVQVAGDTMGGVLDMADHQATNIGTEIVAVSSTVNETIYVSLAAGTVTVTFESQAAQATFVIGTVPDGYRPSAGKVREVVQTLSNGYGINNDKFGYVTIDSDGRIRVEALPAGHTSGADRIMGTITYAVGCRGH